MLVNSDGDDPSAQAARKAFGACLDQLMTDERMRPSGVVRKWSNQKLAEAVRNTPTTISYWRNGERLPEQRLFERLVKAILGQHPESASQDLKDQVIRLKRLWEAAWAFSARGRPASGLSEQQPKLPADTTATKLFGVPSELPTFRGRQNKLEEIQKFFVARPKKPWLALVGMPGAGKTITAAQYFRTVEVPFEAVWWCSAGTRQSLVKRLDELAYELKLPRPESMPIEYFARAALQTLSEKRWCLVYDNAGTPSEIEEFLPPDNVSLLITTQVAGGAEWTNQLEIGLLEKGDAAELLQELAEIDDPAGASGLAKTLGYLPLALAHAGSTCGALLSFAQYAQRLRKHIKAAPPSARYPRSVFATIKVALDTIPEGDRARQLLCALSFCSPERIPVYLVEEIASHQSVGDGLQLILTLSAYSLVRIDPFDDGTRAIVVHRLVQEVGRDISTAPLDLGDLVVRRLRSLFQEVMVRQSPWERCHHLLSHVVARFNDKELPPTHDDDWIDLMTSAARYLRVDGDWNAAAVLIESAAILATEHLPESDGTRINALLEYATVSTEFGKLDEAEETYRHLASVIPEGGDSALIVASCLQAIGGIEEERGKFDEAGQAFASALEIFRVNPAAEANLRVHCAASLAMSLICRKRFSEGEEALQEAFRFSGGDSPLDKNALARAYDALALLRMAQKRSEEGINTAEEAVRLTGEAYGMDPRTANRMVNLANYLASQSRFIESQRVFEEALDMIEKCGSKPRILLALRELRQIYIERGDLYRARQLTERELQLTREQYSEISDDVVALILEVVALQCGIAHMSLDLGEPEEAIRQCEVIFREHTTAYDQFEPEFRELALLCHEALEQLGRFEDSDAIRERYGLDAAIAQLRNGESQF